MQRDGFTKAEHKTIVHEYVHVSVCAYERGCMREVVDKKIFLSTKRKKDKKQQNYVSDVSA